MADRRLKDRPRWILVGACWVRVNLHPVPVVETSNRSGRALTDADKNAVTRWVIGVLVDAGYTVDGLRVRDLVWL